MTIDCSDSVFQLYEVLRDVATGTSYDDTEVISKFKESRSTLIKDFDKQELIPSFVRNYRDLPSFWGFIKEVSPTYEGRRKFLANEFNLLFEHCEVSTVTSPIYSIFSHENTIVDSYIKELWHKSIIRRDSDPEGAITAARTLIEATCKHILDYYDRSYSSDVKLNQLYKDTARELDLAPSNDTEEQFRQLMSGLFTVINALSAIRNRASDSHAIESEINRPDTRHSTLCVTIAGAVSEFLLTTFYDQIPF